MNEEQVAIEALERLGLTEYEARCLVALTRIPHGTAKEVGQVADIPRSRVYETMERLRDRGLAEVQESEPRTFQCVSVDSAVRILRKEYESYFDTVEQSLRELEPVYKETEQAVWAINGHEQVSERVIDIVDDATEEILLIVMEPDLLGEEELAYLSEAGERGVDVRVGTVDDGVPERLEEADVEATLFTTGLVEWFAAMEGTPRIGRLVMVDRGPVLASAVHDERLPGVPHETAAWTDGIDHGFATFAERVFTYELKENVGETYDVTGSRTD